MPLPENQELVSTAGSIVKAFQGAFGTPPGYRPGQYCRVLRKTAQNQKN